MITAPQRYHSLDLWRGFACLAVLVAHSSATSGFWGEAPGLLVTALQRGAIGVPIFFVISGYCIAAATHRAVSDGTSLRVYLTRRARRIFPPYWAAVAFTVCIVAATRAFGSDALTHSLDGMAAIPTAGEVNPYRWLGSLTLTEGWRAHFVWRGGPGYYLPIAWSLGYEEQFYLLCGLLLVVAGRWWLHTSAVVTLLVITVVFTVPIEAVRGFFFDGRWLAFALGIALFVYCHGYRWAILLALPALAFGLYARPSFDALPGEVLVASVAALLMAGLWRFDRAVFTAPVMRPLRWCGERCYSIYLLHWPFAKLAFWLAWTAGARDVTVLLPLSIGLTLLMTIPAVALFFHYVERPCMRPSPQAVRTGEQLPARVSAA